MKRMTYLVMALALALGFTQCKKEQTNTTAETQGVQITLKVDGGASTGSAAGGSRAIVDPAGNANYATVSFETGDMIYVGYNNAYVGSLTYSNNTFSGSVNISETVEGEHLHFYFLGGAGFEPTVDGNTATVVISDQTAKYPVISYAPSNEVFTGEGSYSAKLMNKCSIMKVNATLPDAVAAAPICFTGMNNKVTVHFDTPNGDDNGFEYGIDGEGVIKMPAKDADNVTWAIVLPQAALEEGEEGSAYTEAPSALINYYCNRPQVHEIESNKYYSGSDEDIDLTITTNLRVVNFTYWTSGLDFQEQDYDIYTGELRGYQPPLLGNNDGGWGYYTLKDVTIHESLDCIGNVVLTLKGNNVIGCEDQYTSYAGLTVNGASYNGNQHYTLVIDGDGSLVVSGGYDWPGIGSSVQSCGNIEIRGGHITAIGDGTAPGIGAGKNYACRNITITGGTVIAKGGNLTGSSNGGAGIGTAGTGNQTCGNILITGGTVEATGGYYAAGIGTANLGRCGTITITDGVTQVTATKGDRASKSIGLAKRAAQTSCGTVTIGGTVYFESNGSTFTYLNDGSNYLSQSPLVYPQP